MHRQSIATRLFVLPTRCLLRAAALKPPALSKPDWRFPPAAFPPPLRYKPLGILVKPTSPYSYEI